MDMRNVTVGVVMEVIATTMVQPVPEEETTSPTLGRDNTAIVLSCPQSSNPALDVSGRLRVTTVDNSRLILVIEPCEQPVSQDIGARPGPAIA